MRIAISADRVLGHLPQTVAYKSTKRKGEVDLYANDTHLGSGYLLRMAQRKKKPGTTKPTRDQPTRPLREEPIPQIHAGETPVRIHYIVERAKRLGLKQVDLVRELGVDKGTVSKWFDGGLPDSKNIRRLAAVLQCQEPSEIFRHPDDDWMSRLLRRSNTDQKAQIKRMLEAGFGRTGTGG